MKRSTIICDIIIIFCCTISAVIRFGDDSFLSFMMAVVLISGAMLTCVALGAHLVEFYEDKREKGYAAVNDAITNRKEKERKRANDKKNIIS